MQGQPEHTEKEGGPGDSAIGRACPATIRIAEEAAVSVCRVPDSLKWNSAFQGFEASLGHI